MNYCENDDLVFEALKGVSVCDKLEHEHDDAFSKDVLTNMGTNN